MKHVVKGALCAAMIMAGAQVFADPTSSDSTSHSKMMKDCMAKQKASDSSMSKEDMKKTCMAQIKASRDNSMGAQSTPNQETPTTKGSPAPSTGSTTTPPK
jgi:hypothetical protein